MKIKPLTAVNLTVFTLILLANTAVSQPALLGALSADGEAYIYHDHRIQPGFGYLLSRTVDGQTVDLVTEPARAVTNGNDLVSILGPLSMDLMQIMEATSPQMLYLRLIGDPDMLAILSVTYPEVAIAFAQVFIDTDPVPGRTALYLFTIVGPDGKPTGETIEERLTIRDFSPARPDNLSAHHDQNQIRIQWDYPRLDFSGSDRMIRFQLLARMQGENRFSPSGPALVMRQNDVTRYRAHIPYDPARERFEVIVQAIDVTGTIFASSEPLTVETGRLVVPAPALAISSVLNADGHVELSWPVSPQPEVAGYDLVRIRYSDGDSLMLNTERIPLLENRFTDRDVVPGETYLYYLYHVTHHGIRSSRGNPAPRLIEDWTPPGNPSALMASYDSSSTDITLNWQPGEQTGNFLSFVLLRKKIHPSPDEAWSQINDSTVTGGPFTDSGAGGQIFEEGATYRYGIAAANRNAMRSDTVFADIRIPVLTPPNAPTLVDARIDDGLRVRLSWNASGSGDVTEYRLYRLNSPVPFRVAGSPPEGTATAETGQTPDGPFPFPMPAPTLSELRQARALLASSPANAARFHIDETAEAGASYIYHVTAVDSAGNESPSSPGFGIRVQRASVLPPVRNLQAVAGPGGVVIRWEPLADADGVTYRYRVMRSELANGVFETLTDAVAGTEWTDAGGQAGHWYRIVAIDDAGSRGRPTPSRQAISQR